MVFRDLQEEYERLKSIRDQSGVASEDSSDASTGGQQNRDSELLAEAKLLRQHKGRLEARMQVLEDHNRQLEAQLQRLRQLLDQVQLFLTEVMLECFVLLIASVLFSVNVAKPFLQEVRHTLAGTSLSC